MATDDEKSRLEKLLSGLEIPDIKLSERSSTLVIEFNKKLDEKSVNEEEALMTAEEKYENPYIPDKHLLSEVDKKLHELHLLNKCAKKKSLEAFQESGADPKRPWRTHSNNEKLLRINNDLKRHHEKASDMISPLADSDMKNLVVECEEDDTDAPRVTALTLRNAVDEAKKILPNFRYRNVDNTSATKILPQAHDELNKISENNISLPTVPPINDV